jgi:EAL domain-containing protein (putative c-di-GMP-specific phosphodiesterase class I)
MDVVAEGVETEDQLKLLRKLECENGQGYLFSTPLGGQQLDQFIASCNIQPQIYTDTHRLNLNPCVSV